MYADIIRQNPCLLLYSYRNNILQYCTVSDIVLTILLKLYVILDSDGYVGQVCVLSLQPDPTVACCNGVCNARILSIASIPAAPQP